MHHQWCLVLLYTCIRCIKVESFTLRFRGSRQHSVETSAPWVSNVSSYRIHHSVSQAAGSGSITRRKRLYFVCCMDGLGAFIWTGIFWAPPVLWQTQVHGRQLWKPVHGYKCRIYHWWLWRTNRHLPSGDLQDLTAEQTDGIFVFTLWNIRKHQY